MSTPVIRTSDYKNRDTSGWSPTSSGATTYDSIRTYKRNSTDTPSGYDRLKIRTDTNTGDFSVYKVNPYTDDTLIHTYDGATNNFTIEDSNLYAEFFTGSATYINQDSAITLGTKQDTLALASQNSDTEEERQRLTNLEALLGYKSLTNTGLAIEADNTLHGSLPYQPESTFPENSIGQRPLSPEEMGWGRNTQGPQPTAGYPGMVYRYPLEIPDLGYDFIKITAYEYIRAGINVGRSRESAVERLYNLLNRPLERIILPMQPNLSETNSVDWGGDKLNAVQMALGNTALGSIEALSNFDVAGTFAAFGQGAQNLKEMMNDNATKSFIAAYFAGQAVGTNITARSTGTVINPNLELLFSGPRLRTFNFNFTFTPRSEEESKEIRKIIKTFKRNMAPQRSSSGLFLKTPRIFRLEYIYNDTDRQHPFLNKFKPCAMTNFSVNYTPDGSYMTYGDNGSLTSYAVTMTFGELEPIYADEIDEAWRDMGY